jgi:predicted Zn finger-like uncharacterized protein
MAITVVCPSCGRKLRVADDLNGRRVRCPECETSLTVTVAVAQPDDEDDDEGPTAKLGRPTDLPRRRPAEKLEMEDDDGADGVTAVHYETPLAPSRAALGLGLAALLIGVLALPLSWVPAVGKLAIPVSGFGLVLGIFGVTLAAVRRGHGLAFPLAGLLISLLAFGLAGAQKLGWLNPEPVVKAPAPPSPEEPPAKAEPKPAPPIRDKPAEPVWVDGTKQPITAGDVRLWLTVGVGTVSYDSIVDGKTTSQEKRLLIRVRIENVGKTRKINYTGWAQGLLSPSAATLKDGFDNTYKRVMPEFGSNIVGQLSETTSIYPGKSLEDLLVFEEPVPDVQFLRLVLPAAALGGEGEFRIQIPRQMIGR